MEKTIRREGKITARHGPSATFCKAINLSIPQRFFTCLRVPLFLAGSLLMLALLFLALGIRFTWSSSLPPGLYRTVDAPLTYGALVAVCLPDTLAETARDRGYGNPGLCPGGLAPLLKKVVAMPGDAVHVKATGLTVNGTPIPRTQRRDLDSEGRPIPMIDAGIYTVGAGELWLISNYRSRSWDSRYFGPLPADRVQSVMKPLMTWENF